MEVEPLGMAVKKLERYILALPHAKQLNKLSTQRRDAMMSLRDAAGVARVSVARYLSSDDSDEQAEALQESIEHVTATNEAIMYASQYDLLDAADVAQLSSLAQHIKERLV